MLYETTVGAALPVINTLDRLLQTGDDVYKIEAAISGTLGYVCSETQRGTVLRKAVNTAVDPLKRLIFEPFVRM